MATMSSVELVDLMRIVNHNIPVQTWTKADISAALQAVEDRMRLASTRTALAGDIEAAVPGVFSNPQKELLFGVWCMTFARREGLLGAS